MKIPIDELRQKITATLQGKFSAQEIERISEYLLWADMSGIKTQGTIKLTGTTPLQNVTPTGPVTITRDTKLSQVIDAGGHPAVLVSQQATDAVIQKSKEHGFGIVTVHNFFSSNCAQAFYAERIARKDFIGIVLSRAPASFAPFDSIDPLFGTNPIGFAFPTQNDPLVFDMASAAMTWYGLVLAKARGEKLPEDVAIDKDGNPTVDAAEAMDGALLPFDNSYKGSGIGMVVEIMAGPLAGAAHCSYKDEDSWGATFIAIDPNLLVDIETFKADCSDLMVKVKTSRKKSGVTDIRMPGERATAARAEALKTGMVEVDEAVLKQLG